MTLFGPLRMIAALGLTTALLGCGDIETFTDTTGTLNDIRTRGKLVVLTRNAPTTYYEGRKGPDGYEYQFTQFLGRALGVAVDYRLYGSIEEILAAIQAGEGHIAAAGLTRTETRAQTYRFGPDYKTVQQQVVCHREGTNPKGITDLPQASLLLIRASTYEERLKELQAEVSDLRWQATDELSIEQLLKHVWERQVDCTVANSNIVAVNWRYYPELSVAFAISEEQPLAWILPPDSNKLQRFIEDWYRQIEEAGVMDSLNERFYGHVNIFDFVDACAYRKHIEQRLPKYRALFEAAAKAHNIPWTLLAAQAYQESHWNPKAKSPTGVRGMMMLTQATAKEVGVTNRLDPKQSIMGGARYLVRTIERIPDSVQGRDRIWFALAAYNIGMGHLYDARTLAKQLGKDPDTWLGLQSILPLLSQKQYYQSLQYGYARGAEPVRYVQRIRNYRDILEKHVSG